MFNTRSDNRCYWLFSQGISQQQSLSLDSCQIFSNDISRLNVGVLLSTYLSNPFKDYMHDVKDGRDAQGIGDHATISDYCRHGLVDGELRVAHRPIRTEPAPLKELSAL